MASKKKNCCEILTYAIDRTTASKHRGGLTQSVLSPKVKAVSLPPLPRKQVWPKALKRDDGSLWHPDFIVMSHCPFCGKQLVK